MPVHLGSMGESIQTVIRENAGRMQPGDVYVLNDPYHGGTHLPDITVITPVFGDGREILSSTSAAAATTPTSAAPRRARCRRSPRSIDEEGVQIDNVKLVEAAAARGGDARAAGQRRPTRRATRQNLADLRAQIAANEKGVQELRKHGGAVRPGRRAGLHAPRAGQRRGVGAPRDHGGLKDGRFDAAAGQRRAIRVAVRVDAAARSAEIDFTGTSAQQPNNFNAPRRCAWRRCCTCSARWWTTTSR
jgi:5-oxoprolinase (ATP-hydrolysing)